MTKEYKNWEVYERYIAEILMRDLPPEYCITANAQVTGRISGQRRQIDVLI